jgi:hypothetical protein
MAVVHGALNHPGELFFHRADEGEALPVLADAGHRAIHEHQREILGMRPAELIEVPERLAHGVDPLEPLAVPLRTGSEQQVEPFLGEGEEDVVLAWEVAVDRSRAVFDTIGDLADRHVLIALCYEEIARGVQNRPCDRLALTLLTFLDSQ